MNLMTKSFASLSCCVLLALSWEVLLGSSQKISLSGFCYRYGRMYYMVENRLRRRLPDRFTIESYCDNGLGTIALMNETLHSITTDGEPVPSLWDHHSNMNMVALAMNQSLIIEKILLLPFLNPSILYRRHHKDWVISWRLPDQHSFRVVLVKSLNTTIFSAGFTDSSVSWLKNLAENIASANPKYPFVDLKGEDPRLFELSDGEIYVSYARRFRQLPEIRMVHTELYFDDMDDSKKINVDEIIDLEMVDNVEHFHDQKNWTPFEFEGFMYYINSIWPFQVVNITVDDKRPWVAQANMITNIAFHNIKSHWEYGHIRGGTPALPIGNNTYLSFFHSSSTTNRLQTYVFGAYTFIAKRGPAFMLSSLSRIPIADVSFYEGKWKEQMGAAAFIDYVTFPMSFFIEEGFVFVLVGQQDKEGSLIKLKLTTLLESLIEIK